jgi:hypothetical protein
MNYKNMHAVLGRAVASTFLGLAFTVSANAAIWLRCDQCQTGQASANSVASTALGEVVVYSLANNFALKFENEMRVVGDNCQPLSMIKTGVSKGNAPGSWRANGCSYQLVAIPMTNTSKEDELQDLLRQIYVSTGGTMKTTINVNAGDLHLPEGPITGEAAGSAYDFVGNNNFRSNVRAAAASALNDPAQVGSVGNLANTVTSAIATLVGGDATRIIMVITFSDGSQVTFVYSEGTIRDSETATTAEDGDIMTRDNMPDFFGVNEFNNDLSMENFLRNAERLGVEIVRSEATRIQTAECHSSIRDDGTVQVTCVRN